MARTILQTWISNEAYYPFIYSLIIVGWAFAILVEIRKMRAANIDSWKERFLN